MDFKLNELFYNIFFDILIIRFQRMTATLKNNLSNIGFKRQNDYVLVSLTGFFFL